jgi:hypothetical protein
MSPRMLGGRRSRVGSELLDGAHGVCSVPSSTLQDGWEPASWRASRPPASAIESRRPSVRARANSGPSTPRTRPSSSSRSFSHCRTGLDACSLSIAPKSNASRRDAPSLGSRTSQNPSSDAARGEATLGVVLGCPIEHGADVVDLGRDEIDIPLVGDAVTPLSTPSGPRAPCWTLNLRPLALHGAGLTIIDRHYGHLARDGASTRSNCWAH